MQLDDAPPLYPSLVQGIRITAKAAYLSAPLVEGPVGAVG